MYLYIVSMIFLAYTFYHLRIANKSDSKYLVGIRHVCLPQIR